MAPGRLDCQLQTGPDFWGTLTTVFLFLGDQFPLLPCRDAEQAALIERLWGAFQRQLGSPRANEPTYSLLFLGAEFADAPLPHGECVSREADREL